MTLLIKLYWATLDAVTNADAVLLASVELLAAVPRASNKTLKKGLT